ncbi:MAG: hypothetical protein ABSG25_04955 [Bryobacteraceae bacterium]
MNDMNVSSPGNPAPSCGSSGSLKISILLGAVIALLAATIYLFYALDRVSSDLAKFQQATQAELTTLRENSTISNATARRNLEAMKEDLEAARRQAAMAVGQAKTEAQAHADALAKRVAEEQRRQEARMTSQITNVQEEANTKIGAVSTDVTTVKSDVASTKEELQRTIGTLKTVQGDMGQMSGLIATNGKELAALKEYGDRNYFEFNLGKSKAPQKVGNVAVLLKKTDPKKNTYSIDVVADDKTVSKKDKGINEPVQFFVSKSRQPYELVVNEIKRDQIVGYLATPKVQASR